MHTRSVPVLVLAMLGPACMADTTGGESREIDYAAASSIRVMEATFGANVGAVAGNVTSQVAGRCDGLTSCTFTIDPAQMFPPAPPCASFADVSNANPFCHYLANLRDHGVMPAPAGCPPGGFCPGDPVTRREAAAYVVRAAFGEWFSYSPSPYFADVGPADPFFRYVQELREQGITSGCSPTSYESVCTTPNITRGQAAVFLMRAKYGEAAGGPPRFTAPSAQMFTDVASSHPFFRFIQQLAALGITSGTSPTEFSPERPITKGEMAVLVARTFYPREVPPGNPLSTRPKDFSVRYACSGGSVATATVPADSVGRAATLTCSTELPPQPIRIVSATYGEDEGAPQGNATWDVAARCEGRTSCDYFVDVARLGDPAPGRPKMFGVRYRCGTSPLEVQTGLSAEANLRTLRIDCADGTLPPGRAIRADHVPVGLAPIESDDCSFYFEHGAGALSPLAAARRLMEPWPQLDWEWATSDSLAMNIMVRGDSVPFMRISGPYLRRINWIDWGRLTAGQAYTAAGATILWPALVVPGLREVVLTALIGTALTYLVVDHLMRLWHEASRANPRQGAPGSTVWIDTEDGQPKQARRYGSDGYPETDVDYDHDHGQGRPHAHDWGRPADGSPPTHADRAPGRPVQPSDPRHPGAP